MAIAIGDAVLRDVGSTRLPVTSGTASVNVEYILNGDDTTNQATWQHVAIA